MTHTVKNFFFSFSSSINKTSYSSSFLKKTFLTSHVKIRTTTCNAMLLSHLYKDDRNELVYCEIRTNLI